MNTYEVINNQPNDERLLGMGFGRPGFGGIGFGRPGFGFGRPGLGFGRPGFGFGFGLGLPFLTGVAAGSLLTPRPPYPIYQPYPYPYPAYPYYPY